MEEKNSDFNLKGWGWLNVVNKRAYTLNVKKDILWKVSIKILHAPSSMPSTRA